MNRQLAHSAITVTLVSVLIASPPARAELIPVEKSAEANQVRVHFSKGMAEGVIQVNECLACPLNLAINSSTRFFLNGKEIGRNSVEALSGKAATVIYSKDGKQANRVRW